MSELKVNKLYERDEDMSPDGKLTLVMQPDGDIIITVFGKNPGKASYRTAHVEFCTSGGRSPYTLMALRELMVAMEKDNMGVEIEIDNPYMSLKEPTDG